MAGVIGGTLGFWSDEDLYQGAMEAADIAFRPDGNGWAYWSRDGGTFFVLRFSWHTTHGHRLTLDLREQLSGTWDLEGRTARHRVTSQAAYATKIALTYEIHLGEDALGRPATLLEASQPIRPRHHQRPLRLQTRTRRGRTRPSGPQSLRATPVSQDTSTGSRN